MRPVTSRARLARDPAPSRFRYRLTRLWLRPSVRRLINIGVPLAVGVLAAWTILSHFDLRGHALALYERVQGAVVEQPQFMITEIAVPDVSEDLEEQIRTAAFVTLPKSSLEVSVAAVRDRIQALDAVERARVQVRPNGVLEIRAVERIAVVVWRKARTLQLLDGGGVRVAEIDSRLRRPDLPLIAGAGASSHVPEAMALLDVARPISGRVRGLVRIGERRWDVALDRGQLIRLPETEPAEMLRRVMDLQASEELLNRDVLVVDMRDPQRPMVQLNEHAVSEIERLKRMSAGEDA
jgi:cell division protein FtsQ